MMDHKEGWVSKQRILVILAHPDDPEFFCGASVARWISLGHEIHYCLLTKGERGFTSGMKEPGEICRIRMREQQEAAEFLGVKSVRYLDLDDGYLFPSLEGRREVVRVIRTIKPTIVVTCDPANRFTRPNALNHPDHLAAGEIVVSAIFPATGNPLFFPELMQAEGLAPCAIKELMLSLTAEPNLCLNVTRFWGKKIQALKHHRSQIGDPTVFEERMLARYAKGSTEKRPRYEERFRRLRFGQ
jgi:LmbE family N-acetylglucosaminyl deacetylase